MEGRGTSGDFESPYPTTPALRTEATPINGSNENFTTCDLTGLISNLLSLIIAFLGLAGNAVVFWLLGFRLHRNAISVYILNLAAADILFLCFHSIYTVMIGLNNNLHLPSFLVCFLINVEIISYTTGLGMLSAISTERCLSILWPIWYHCNRPRHTSAVICALLWALSMLLGIMKFYICCNLQKDIRDYWCMNVDFSITAWLMFLCVILSGSSLALLGRILYGPQHKPMTRLYVTILLTVLVFLLCGLPFGIIWLLVYWIHINNDALFCLSVVIDVLPSVNSCANPFIYFFVGSFRQQLQQRQTFKMILQRALQEDEDEDRPSGNPGDVRKQMEAVRKGLCPGPQLCF